MKITTIVGARPQFIKLAPFSFEVRKFHEEIIIHTGQHYDFHLSGKLFEDLDIPEPDIHLNIGSASHGIQTGAMLEQIENELLKQSPDVVIVFGDTNSTLAGALASAKLSIPIVHIEAGLRSFNRQMPEEINRVLTDHCSNYLFAPTAGAIENLKRENLTGRSWHTGDIMVDVLLKSLEIVEQKSSIFKELSIEKHSYYLLTLHRPYNVDHPDILQNIFKNLSQLNHTVIFPIHPRTKKNIEHFGILVPEIVRMIEPQGYFDFLNLQMHSMKILTDSGGIQKESYILQKPCITLRSETEWVETVENGWNLLVDVREDFTRQILEFKPEGIPDAIFGKNVAEKMVAIINENL